MEPKICTTCGIDVSEQVRFKDPAGNYYCEPCYRRTETNPHPVAASAPAAPALAVHQSAPRPALPTFPASYAHRPAATELASRLMRLGARVIDNVLFFGVVLVPTLLAGKPLGERITSEDVPALAVFAFLAFAIAQAVLLTTRGQTIGKCIMRIRVVDFQNEALPGFLRVVLMRSLLFVALSFIPLFSLIDALFIFREDQRCLHDLVAGTKVTIS